MQFINSLKKSKRTIAIVDNKNLNFWRLAFGLVTLPLIMPFILLVAIFTTDYMLIRSFLTKKPLQLTN